MTDIEKVIKALELCVTPVPPSECEESCIKCAYMNEARGNKLLCIPNLLKDALLLLKEQEAVKPRVSTVEQRCGNCNKVIEMDGWITCPWCGKMIDWERWLQKNG